MLAYPVVLIPRTLTLASIEQVPELISKMAISEAPGTVAPVAPPLVADHLVVVFQFPDPT